MVQQGRWWEMSLPISCRRGRRRRNDCAGISVHGRRAGRCYLELFQGACSCLTEKFGRSISFLDDLPFLWYKKIEDYDAVVDDETD